VEKAFATIWPLNCPPQNVFGNFEWSGLPFLALRRSDINALVIGSDEMLRGMSVLTC
jgi:hypothetical protein